MTDPMVIGLTGPTGSGKGEVAALLHANDAAIIDCDLLAREVTQPGHPCLQALADRFSPTILRENGSLDRSKLAALAFADREHTATLNAVTHPHILALCRDRIRSLQQAGQPLIVLDAPLLFESGLDRDCTHTVAVLSSPAVRLRRIMARDGLTKEAAQRRMAMQPNDDFYRERAEAVILNDGDRSVLRKRVEEWLSCVCC